MVGIFRSPMKRPSHVCAVSVDTIRNGHLNDSIFYYRDPLRHVYRAILEARAI